MAFSAVTQSDFLTLDADYEFLTASGAAIAIQLTPGESGTLLFSADAAGTTDDIEVEVLQGHRISAGNGLDGATSASDIELDTVADGFSTDDDLNGTFIVMTSGDEAGEGRLIVDSVAADDGVNLEHALSGTPSATETYDLYRLSTPAPHIIDMGSAISDDAQHNLRVPVHAADGEWLLVRARATGSTDAHRLRMSYQTDGVSI